MLFKAASTLLPMIHIRPNAIRELQRLLKKQANQHLLVYLDVASGGCYDWTYRLSLTPAHNQQEETPYRFDEFTLVLPNVALPHLQGLTIDYSEDLMGGGFRFINPQAQQVCGCGNSFSLHPAAEAEAETPHEDCSQANWQIRALNN